MNNNEINDTWKKEKLINLCKIVTGDKDVNHGNENGKYEFFTCAQESFRSDTYSFEGESILIAGNGNFHVNKYNGKFEAYQRTYVLQDFKINYDYLYYYILASMNEIKGASRGSTIKYIRIGNLNNLIVKFPEKETQKRIAGRIDELFSEIDNGIDLLNSIKIKLEAYKQAVLKEAYESSNTDEKLNLRTLETICEVTGGLTKNSKRNELELKYPYLRVANVYLNSLSLNEIKYIGVNDNDIKRTLLKQGDLLFVEGNGSLEQIGRVAVWNEEVEGCLHQNHIIKARPKEDMVLSKYILYYFISEVGRRKIKKQAASTSGLYTLSITKIKNLTIPYVTVEKQLLIIQEIEKQLTIYDDLENTISESIEKAKSLKQSILKKAFDGKLVIC